MWLFGGVLCVLGALCFAELATMLPRAGGLYVYLREAYGQPVAFLFGWMEFLLSRPASLGALSAAFIGSLTLALDWRTSQLTELVLVLTLIGGVAWVNIAGVIWGGRVQMVTTLIKGTSLGLMAAAPVLLFPFTGVGIDLANYASTAVPRYSGLASQLGAVLLAVMWAYNGWHGITPLTEEIRNPQRTIPRSLFGGIGILIVLYISANLAYHGVLTMGEMIAAGDSRCRRDAAQASGPAWSHPHVGSDHVQHFWCHQLDSAAGPAGDFCYGTRRGFLSRSGSSACQISDSPRSLFLPRQSWQ